jgi:hypothetical protein
MNLHHQTYIDNKVEQTPRQMTTAPVARLPWKQPLSPLPCDFAVAALVCTRGCERPE